MKTFTKLLKNETILNIRDANMVIFAIIMPLIVTTVLGFIYGTKPAFENADYTFMDRSFSSMSAISICAGGLMGLPIAVSLLREKKILKHFHVTPVSPIMLLGVELCVYVIYCIVSMALIAVVSKIAWGVWIRGSVAAFIGSWLLTMVSTLSIGMMVGGVAKNSKQAAMIASILYFPMIVFSGVTVPLKVMPTVVQKVVMYFPLTQGMNLMNDAFLGLNSGNVMAAVIVMVAVLVVCTVISVRFFKWE